ncbi:sigma-70 family RNA polymerase sigma factor [Streptomyces sp. TRM S81-3]|uniref:Sigma-70 family RNA polymerase sigma factor n=1 Tax=Streptomyces griseicoloratus TaxID=2752516 RepID=A0A926KYZ7_9ACTN|nr:sigma-70 family RNA polymerase sigma factor [Streptomyces griseicoloratus]MBD0419432.1 sigma-70 family RNA polymerase sigma factor [Streptomyces griseicoloratus]
MSAEAAVRSRDFETFFSGAYPRLLAQAIMVCGSREDAEDAVQEAFVEAYRAWDRIAGYELPEAWVYRVAVQRLWKTHRRRRTGQDRLPDVPVPVQAGPEQTAEAREVLRLLAALPPRQRATMVLFCLHGWSQKEVAKALRMTRGGVAANVSKARQTLREALDMAADETSGRDPFMGGAEPAGAGRTDASRIDASRIDVGRLGLGADPVVTALRHAEAWLRAAVVADPAALDRARAAVARRLEERR